MFYDELNGVFLRSILLRSCFQRHDEGFSSPVDPDTTVSADLLSEFRAFGLHLDGE